MVNRILDVTLTALIVYWIATHANEFAAVTNATTVTTINSVKALWGK